ncbi:TetR/AcrR family transcriptional regulator [Streptomyces sp. NPDC005373]|uniref:TetR/AcrR family transcriptional regulator n=1 Tax=Streptomyces sp. NPDC005373 TaxID=3156879 RepID=UPI00339EA7BA
MTDTAPSASKRGPYARSRVRREQISDAVLRLVDAQGHEGVTTALVAKESGVPEPSVLYHFPTKDHLLVGAMERADDLSADDSGAEGDDSHLDPEDLRRALQPGPVGDRRVRLYLMLKGQAATPDHPAGAYLRARTERSVRIFSRLVARRQHEGLAHPGLDPDQVALQITALMDGVALMRMTNSDLDAGALVADGVRRLVGENWMRARALLDAPDVGL